MVNARRTWILGAWRYLIVSAAIVACQPAAGPPPALPASPVAAVSAVAAARPATDSAPAAAPPLAVASRVAPRPPASPGNRPAVAEWTMIAAAGPSARRDHSLTHADPIDRLYLFGGRAQGTPLNDLWSFDPAAGRWTEIPVEGPRPPARYGHNALWDATANRLIVTLGQAGSTFFNDVWAFDPAAGAWRELGRGAGEKPSIRYGSGSAHDRAGNRFFVTHGFTSQGRFDDTWVFDLAAETWAKIPTTGPVPLKRCLTRAAWDPATGQLLLFGGQSNENPFHNDLWALDVARGVWAEKVLPNPPSPRSFYGAAFDETARRWYIVEGNTADGPAGDAHVYDAAADAWSPLPSPAPLGRVSLDLTNSGARLYLFGGNDRTQDLADLWIWSG